MGFSGRGIHWGLLSPQVKQPTGGHPRSIEPDRALVAETLKLERTLSDLVNRAYGLTLAEIALMWQTVSPRMPSLPPDTSGPSLPPMARRT